MDFQTTSFRARRSYVWTYFRRIRAADQEDHAMSVKNLIPPVLLLLLAFAAAPVTADTVRIYVTNAAGDSVHVVDPATNKVVQVIKGIEAAHGINFSPDGARVYVSNEADNTLDVVDRKSGKFIKKVPLSGHPNNIAVTKDGGRVVVAIAEQVGALDFIDTASLSRAKTIPVNGRQHNVYVTPDGKYSVSGSTRTGVISVVDLQSEQPAWELKLDAGVRPMTFEVGADGSTRRVFAQLSNFNGFAVVDFAARKEIEKIKLPDEPTGFGAQEQRLGSPSHGIGVAPDGKTLWVTSLSANAVFVYALPDLKLQGHVALPELKLKAFTQPLGALPNWVTFTPDSKLIYVSNSGIRSVSAIDTAAMKVVANIPVGEVPKRINTLVMR
jgi:YVTN family beta-propeller protein